MPDSYVWKPTLALVERSNVGRFMKRHGIGGYQELLARSIGDIEWFWRAVVDDLDIEFSRPFDTILDASRGIAWSRWFEGGTINLATHCLDRHAEGGAVRRSR